jgi:hypothetical protein
MLTMICFITSCSKESDNTITTMRHAINFKVSLSDAKDQSKGHYYPWLYFQNAEDYCSAVENIVLLDERYSDIADFEDALSYQSMRNTLTEEQRDSLRVFDEVLAVLLNPEGKIQIGEYLLTINLIEHNMYVEDLSGNVSPFYMSTEDNFLDYINGKISKEELENSLQGQSSKLTKEDELTCEEDLTYYSGNKKLTMKLSASNAGIYSSIYSKISRTTGIVTGAPELFIQVQSGSYYRIKSTNQLVYMATTSNGGTSQFYKIRSYYSTTRFNIHDYSYTVYFSCDQPYNPIQHTYHIPYYH